MRKLDYVLKEYVNKLSSDNLRFLYDRLSARLEGDVATVLEFLSKNTEIDRWLSSSKNAIELYEMVDYFQEFVNKEYTKKVAEYINS